MSKRRMRKSLVLLTVWMTLTVCGCGSDGNAAYQRGVDAYDDGDYAAAIEYFEEAKELGASDYDEWELYKYLGYCYFELDMYEGAIANYQKALEECPEEVDTMVDLAIAYRQSGDYDKAEELYMQALEIEPEHAALNSSLGTLYILKNDPKTAITYFNRAIDVDPSLAVAYGNAALAYAMVGDFETAEEYLDMSIVRGYENVEAIRNMIEELR